MNGSRTTVGTWAWATKTNGRLRRRDRAELLRQAVLVRLGQLPPHLRSSLSAGRALTLPDPPDSVLARAAEEELESVSPSALVGHCLRTWAFAALFAQRDGVAHDPELLYVACLLHDLGLTASHDGADRAAACFAVEGARAAHALMCQQQQPDDRAETVATAICLHLNVTVPPDLGGEAFLLSKGVTLDVTGHRLRELPRPNVDEVVTRWPREGSSALLIEAMRRQAERRPDSRAALLQNLGFAGLVRANPLDRAGTANVAGTRGAASHHGLT